ncbi:MAG TPA: SDR family NAD(P)-dependent oxidoreductase [Sphingobium sp.]|nr:SDR family NAD(P)-dependent oxidoreductase [Sphingobium sp.]
MKRAYEDAVVVVSGASTGLGRAIAVGAAEQGARAVVINFASSAAEAEITADRVGEAGGRPLLVQGNVGSDEDCRRIVAAAEPFGRVDALFNNAGVSRAVAHGDLEELSEEDFLRIYRVNVIGAFQMVRAARALLEASDRAAVVNSSAVGGVNGGGSSIAYAASKGALNTMTKSLAMALAPKIRVNAICPGFIDSPWFDRLGVPGGSARLREQVRKVTPLRRAASGEDIADTALFFGSDAARHVTGELLVIDGGLNLSWAPPPNDE